MGYIVRIYSGVKPAPEIGNWVETFIVGLKLLIIALIILWVAGIVFAVITTALEMIPIVGWLVALFLYPVWTIFAAQYMTLAYESAPAPA